MKRIWVLLLCIPFLGCLAPSSPGPGPGGSDSDDVDVGDVGGAPIDDGWTWVEVEGSACGNGKRAGIGVWEGSDPSTVLFFMAGGGACWDWTSCYLFEGAANIEVNYSEAHFRREIQVVNSTGVLKRDGDLFADATWVYIPYCTADLHAGDSVGAYEALNPDRKIHHKGAVNIEAYLTYLRASYTEVGEVFVVGSSAGGYGAMLNYHRFQAAFPEGPVHVLADGAPMIPARDGRWGMWKSAWKMSFPDGCEQCKDSLPAWAEHVISENQDSRFGLLTWDEDLVIALYFSYQWGLKEAIAKLIDENYPGEAGAQAAAFFKGGTEHGMLHNYKTLRDDDGNSLQNFVQAWAQGR